MKTPERRHWHRSGVFIVNFEYISDLLLVFLLLTLNRQLPAGLKDSGAESNLRICQAPMMELIFAKIVNS